MRRALLCRVATQFPEPRACLWGAGLGVNPDRQDDGDDHPSDDGGRDGPGTPDEQRRTAFAGYVAAGIGGLGQVGAEASPAGDLDSVVVELVEIDRPPQRQQSDGDQQYGHHAGEEVAVAQLSHGYSVTSFQISLRRRRIRLRTSASST